MFLKIRKYIISTLVFIANAGLVLAGFVMIKNKEEAKKSTEEQGVSGRENQPDSVGPSYAEGVLPEAAPSEENEPDEVLPSADAPEETVSPKLAPKAESIKPAAPVPVDKKKSSAKTKTS